MSANVLPTDLYDDPVVREVSAFNALYLRSDMAFQNQDAIIPGLLQTREYASALLDNAPRTYPPELHRYLLDTRAERLAHVTGAAARICMFEAVSASSDHLPAPLVTRALRHVADVTMRHPNVDVRIVTRQALEDEAEIAAIGPFTLLELPRDGHGGVPRYAWMGSEPQHPVPIREITPLMDVRDVLFNELALPRNESIDWLHDQAA